MNTWTPRWTRTALLCTPLLLLGGCASTRLVDSDVQSFSQLRALPAPPTYRFERTLSQQAHDVVTFLAWASNPEMVERKRMGVRVVCGGGGHRATATPAATSSSMAVVAVPCATAADRWTKSPRR